MSIASCRIRIRLDGSVKVARAIGIVVDFDRARLLGIAIRDVDRDVAAEHGSGRRYCDRNSVERAIGGSSAVPMNSR